MLSAGCVPLSLALVGLGKVLERRAGLSRLGSFLEVIFFSPKLGRQALLHALIFFYLLYSSVFSHVLLLPPPPPSSVQIEALKIKPPDPVEVGGFGVASGHLRMRTPRQRLTPVTDK